MTNRVLEGMKGRCVAEGLEEGTPRFNLRYLQLRVEKCKQLQRVMVCSVCPSYEFCETVKEYMRAKHLPQGDARDRDKQDDGES
jgi:hypothetical protein